MPTGTYETLFALDSTRMSAEGDAIRNALHANIEKYGGELLVARPWDENGKLIYPIRKQKKAYFYIVYYKLETQKQIELERDFAINENILRQMTSRILAKWENTMLEIARNEAGSRFALKGMTDDSAPTGEGIVSNDPMVRGEGGPGAGGPGGPGGGYRGRGPRRDDDAKPE